LHQSLPDARVVILQQFATGGSCYRNAITPFPVLWEHFEWSM